MFKSLKINIAIVICLTFVIRILFLNVGVVNDAPQSQSFVKSQFSTVLKKRKQFDSHKSDEKKNYTSYEMYEEDNDDDDDKVVNPFLLTNVFYSLVENKTIELHKKNIPTDNYPSNLYSDRYLQLQVIRI